MAQGHQIGAEEAEQRRVGVGPCGDEMNVFFKEGHLTEEVAGPEFQEGFQASESASSGLWIHTEPAWMMYMPSPGSPARKMNESARYLRR